MKGEIIMKKLAILLIGILLVSVSCKKKVLDTPEIKDFPEGKVWTVGQLLDSLAVAPFRFDKSYHKDATVKGYVIADETHGNIYRSFYLRGEDGRCIAVNRISGSDDFVVRIGDYVGFSLYGTIDTTYFGLPQIQALDQNPNKHIVIYQRGMTDKVQPREATIDEIKAGAFLCDLVKLKNVQYDVYEGLTYANGQTAASRNLSSCDGGAIITRTSNKASFALDPLPSGKGTMTSIVSLYNKYSEEWQLLIRNLSDVNLTGPRCGEGGEIMELPYQQNFSASFGTYMPYNVLGDQTWIIDFETAKMTGKVGNDYLANEDWLISSPIDLTGDNVKVTINYLARYFSNFSNELVLKISEDYEYGNDPTEYSWTDIPFEWENVGDWNTFLTNEVAIDEFIGKIVTLAVRYVSPAGSCGTIEIKSIKVENGVPTPPPATIFNESFATSQGDFTIQNVYLPEGLNYVWAFSSEYSCMKASAYLGHAFESESWLISPSIDLNGYASALLSFEHAYKYGANHTEEMTLWVSTDYESGLPSTATWTQIDIPTYPGGTNFTFVSSGDIDVSSYLGTGNFHFAFRYTSTDAAAATWEVKNVLIKE